VYRIKSVCDDAKVPHPMILSESGRAMVAYSSVLIVDVLGSSKFESAPELEKIEEQMKAEQERVGEVPQPVVDLVEAYKSLTDRNLEETYHDAVQARDEAMSLFALGYMSLPMRAAAERLFWCIGLRILDRASKRAATGGSGELPEEFESLPEVLSDIYFCNFSLFQSMPDSWAIDQLFPICPIHRLDQQPTRRAILADITCDSDGKIDHFVDKRVEKKTLELHELIPISHGGANGNGSNGATTYEPYYLGVFLLGAYQEILGDLHNLLGDTHAVHISVEKDGRWEIEEVIEGDTVEEVLQYVQYDTPDLKRIMRQDVEAAQRQGRLTLSEGKSLLKFFDDGLEGYTYLEG
jgi:arginine decarboxylase